MHTEHSQCCVTIVYSFHCTIWWLAALHHPPSSIHYRLTFSLVAVLFFPLTCLRPPTRGEAAKRGDTTMTRANVWPFCVVVTGAIVSPEQWPDANSECSDCDRVLLTMKTLLEPSKEKFFRGFAGCSLHDQNWEMSHCRLTQQSIDSPAALDEFKLRSMCPSPCTTAGISAGFGGSAPRLNFNDPLGTRVMTALSSSY